MLVEPRDTRLQSNTHDRKLAKLTHRREGRCPHLADLGHFADFPHPAELEHIHRLQPLVKPDATTKNTTTKTATKPEKNNKHNRVPPSRGKSFRSLR